MINPLYGLIHLRRLGNKRQLYLLHLAPQPRISQPNQARLIGKSQPKSDELSARDRWKIGKSAAASRSMYLVKVIIYS